MAPARYNGKRDKYDEDLELYKDDDGEPMTMGKLVAMIAQHMLASPGGKSAVKENLLRSFVKVDSVTWECLLKKTNEKLRRSCGYTIVQKDGTLYLTNILPGLPNVEDLAEMADAQKGFRFIVLVFLMMERPPSLAKEFGKVPSERMWKFFETLGYSSTEPDEVLGDIKMLINTMINEGLLAVSAKQSGPAPGDDILYEWGPVAVKTISPQMVFDAFLKIHDTNAAQWQQHAEKVADWQFRFAKEYKKHSYYDRKRAKPDVPGGRGRELKTQAADA
ncbi:unnamed protein product, partial [Mesorhabditis spiculigera]